MEGVRREVAVKDLGELKLDEETQEEGDVINTFVGQFESGVHRGAPTRVWGKSSLYRGGWAEGKMQANECEHGNYREVRLRRNCWFSIHLTREIRALMSLIT